MKESVYIVAARRTAIGSFGGKLKDFPATRLGALAIAALIEQSGLPPEAVDEVLMGSVLQADLGQAPARQASKGGGLPDKVACTTVNKVCASGMKAVAQAAQGILLNDAGIAIAGGMENMSRVPFYAGAMRWGNKYGNSLLVDGLSRDGLTDAYDGLAMGNAAELCASTCGISREAQDAFAVQSYTRAQAAWEQGRFAAEIVPVDIPAKAGNTVFAKDEEPYNVFFEKIPGLRPAFQKDGTVTAANASSMNDGAAALLLVSASKLKEHNLTPLARIVSYADAEQAPEWFTTTPSLALPLAVRKAGLTMNDIDSWELNEAFAVVGIENTKRMELDPEKVNRNGGAVALGHPLGCSGARILVTLIHILLQTNGRYGAAGICNGGGGASAMVLERC